MRQVLVGARLFTGERMLDGHAVVVEGERIRAVVPVDAVPTDAQVQRLPEDALLVPGFLDAQVNGAGGVLFNDTPVIVQCSTSDRTATFTSFGSGATTGVRTTDLAGAATDSSFWVIILQDHNP